MLLTFLYNEKWRQFHEGVSNIVDDMLKRYFNAKSLSIKNLVTWFLIYSINCTDKSTAVQLETKIKNKVSGFFSRKKTLNIVISISLYDEKVVISVA